MSNSGCNSCPAYAKCTVNYRGSSCAALRASYGLDSDPKTNADRIRSMSDEKLGELLYSVYSDGLKDGIGQEITGPWKVTGNWTDWLQQPVKEET